MDIYLAGSNGRRNLIELAIKGNIHGYIFGRKERQKPHSDCIYRGGYDVYNVTPEQIISYGHLSCRRRVRQSLQRMAKNVRKFEGGGRTLRTCI